MPLLHPDRLRPAPRRPEVVRHDDPLPAPNGGGASLHGVSELKRLFGYMRPYVPRMILAAVFLGIAAALMGAVLATIKPLANEVFGMASTAATQAAPAAPVAPTPGRFDILAWA